MLLLSSSLLIGQNSNIEKDQTFRDKSYISVNLLSAFNPLNPRYRVGYMKSIAANWRLGLDFGYGSNNLSFTDYVPILDAWGKIDDDYRLWEIRPEVYYIINPNKLTQIYFSSELFYIHHKDVFHNNFIATKNKGFFIYESANYRRQKYGMHVKFGVFTNVRKKLGLNIYTGLGFRFRENSYSNIINPVPWVDRRDMIVIDYHEYEGLYFGWNWSLGIKLLYRL